MFSKTCHSKDERQNAEEVGSMVMMMKGRKECLLAQIVSVSCMHPTMVCNYMIINHIESTEGNLLIFYS